VCIDFWGQPEAGRQLADQGVDVVVNIAIFPLLHGHWKMGAMVRAFDNFVPVIGINTADYNAVIGGKRSHQHGGGSFVIQMPKMLDREDFRRWLRSLDTVVDWVRTEMGQLEQIQIVELDLRTARRFRRDFWGRFGIRR
jgi:predicted amidohydrolase